MAVQRISRSFKDISLSFDPHPVTKDLQVLKNESAIRRSVRNIVQTIPTERFSTHCLGPMSLEVFLILLTLVLPQSFRVKLRSQYQTLNQE